MEPTDLRHHFLIRKKPTSLAVIKKDSRPLLWNPEEKNRGSPCEVCRTNQSRYTCPRCSLPYCSVACFQAHTSTENESSTTCTELFYQERVHQVLDLQVKDKKETTQQIMQRVHEQQSTIPTELPGIAPCGVPEEQLYDLLMALEKEDEDKVQQLLRSNQKLRSAVARGIQHDDLYEWLLDAWIPWWMPQLVLDAEAEEEPELVAGKSLDQYIVSLPQLSSLRTGPCADLQFNVLQVLYATAWTLRLYYGPFNAQENAEQAVETLLIASSVLANNASFESLEAVLTHCAVTCTNEKDDCNASWTELMNDLWVICQNKRFVLKCLLEAKVVVKKAAAQAKQEKDNDSEQKSIMLRRIGKKIDFHASWCNDHYNRLDSLVPDIRAWVEEWSSESNPVFLRTQQETSRSCSNKNNEMIRFHEAD